MIKDALESLVLALRTKDMSEKDRGIVSDSIRQIEEISGVMSDLSLPDSFIWDKKD
tara:strand:+ start:496 stop:663 length:168 start_codon:yes stop_codon:yes gene_type:complete